MSRSASILRICVSLTLLCAGCMMAAGLLGFFPDRRKEVQKSRAELCEAIAVNCGILASSKQTALIEQNLEFIAHRNEDLVSAGLRDPEGNLIHQIGDHDAGWRRAGSHQDNGCFSVPILDGNQLWAHLELRFPSQYAGWARYMDPTFARFLALTTLLCAMAFGFYLSRVLTVLNPSRVVPDRVRKALDSLSEGVVLLDHQQRIVLANRAFAATAGYAPDELLGRALDGFQWSSPTNEAILELPWARTAREQKVSRNVSLVLANPEQRRFFRVNASPILDEDGSYLGALTSFDDITDLEEKQAKLREMLEVVRQSRDEIRRQNEELMILATRDPLTACLNRRTFFEQFDTLWKMAQRYDQPLSCMMVDIDFFKSINDRYGHATGDDVLRQTSATLLQNARETDVVGRYGGEEFCVLMPQSSLDEATIIAERLRQAVAEMKPRNVAVTASFGISSLALGAKDSQHLLEQADKCLYVAKRRGRNQVIRYDQLPPNMVDEPLPSESGRRDAAVEESMIPYSAVTGLLSALAFRDTETAAHSARVADWSVLLARRHMSAREAYIVEIAALLHDIGKVGVPDAILLKPDRLTAEEWQVMAMHERFGVEIINSSFKCDALTEMVRTHHARYIGNPRKPHLPCGKDISLGARIICIADAFDAMVSDRPYRKGISSEDAFRELEKCKGQQFDPDLVDEFISTVRTYTPLDSEKVQSQEQRYALGIGMQIERIVGALDSEDVAGVAALTRRLEATARVELATEIADAARQVYELAEQEPDLATIVGATHELLDLCRASHAKLITRARQQSQTAIAKGNLPIPESLVSQESMAAVADGAQGRDC